MDAVATFDSTKDFLQLLLKGIQDGKTQLPDFQRGWTWDDDHIKGLLASISLAFPIGVVMLLDTGNEAVRFLPRPVEGVTLSAPQPPDRLILDGQQRLTSLFLALVSQQPVVTKDARGKSIRRWYYLDVAKCLDPNSDREDAIVSIPEDRQVRNFRGEVIKSYSTPEEEYEAGLFPLSQVFDYAAWRRGYSRYFRQDDVKLDLFDQFEQKVIEAFKQYQVPLIILRRETPKEAVCQVFEKVNTGGVALNVFELLTATFAADNFRLRPDWAERTKRLGRHRVLQGLENTYFLQSVALLSTYMRSRETAGAAVSCKRKDILQLSLDEYKRWADPITTGLERAAKFLHSQCIFSARDVPYTTQLVPLSAMFVALGDDAETEVARAKLERWYWCGVFGELYGGTTETRFAKDLPEAVDWILRGGPEPTTVADAHFPAMRLRTLRTRNSAAYKGLNALLLHNGARDFRTGERIEISHYLEESVDIHHIFPKAYCQQIGINPGRVDSVVNKTPLAAKTNRIIGGNAPSAYISVIEQRFKTAPSELNAIVHSHLIPPDILRQDDFEAFYAAREAALLEVIERATGKPSIPSTEPEDEEVPEEELVGLVV